MAAALAVATVVDRAVADPAAIAAALRARLGPHPVPQSDPRTRGLMVEVGGAAEDHARLRAALPALGALLALVRSDPSTLCVLAVNETPPTSTDSFLLRPHLDRRWLAGGFAGAPARATTVVFLDFSPEGEGGELVVLPRGAFACGPPPRDGARRAVADAGGLLVHPRPGRACRIVGEQPHAVLGYTAPAAGSLRLAAVLAEFTIGPGDPPARPLLP